MGLQSFKVKAPQYCCREVLEQHVLHWLFSGSSDAQTGTPPFFRDETLEVPTEHHKSTHARQNTMKYLPYLMAMSSCVTSHRTHTWGIRRFAELPKLGRWVHFYWHICCFLWARILENSETHVWLRACSINVSAPAWSWLPLFCLTLAGGLVWEHRSLPAWHSAALSETCVYHLPAHSQATDAYPQKPDFHGVTVN